MHLITYRFSRFSGSVLLICPFGVCLFAHVTVVVTMGEVQLNKIKQFCA